MADATNWTPELPTTSHVWVTKWSVGAARWSAPAIVTHKDALAFRVFLQREIVRFAPARAPDLPPPIETTEPTHDRP
jgi:hypothetical protein